MVEWLNGCIVTWLQCVTMQRFNHSTRAIHVSSVVKTALLEMEALPNYATMQPFNDVTPYLKLPIAGFEVGGLSEAGAAAFYPVHNPRQQLVGINARLTGQAKGTARIVEERGFGGGS